MAKQNFGIKECAKCEYNLRCQECIYNKTDISRAIAEAKAETVKKIADLLWQGESEKLNISVGGKYYDKQEFIDYITKEMLEGEK